MKGYTLIEFVIYIGIVIIVLLSSLSFAWTIIQDQTKIQLYSEVNYNGSFVLEKIEYYINRAKDFEDNIYNTNPGTIDLDFESTPNILIDSYSKEITLGNRTVNITKLRLTEGTNPAIDLTTDKMDVTNFTINDYSTTNAQNIGIELTISSINPDNVQMYAAEKSWTSSATIKQK